MPGIFCGNPIRLCKHPDGPVGHTLQGVMAVYNRAEYEAERIDAMETLERVVLEVVKND